MGFKTVPVRFTTAPAAFKTLKQRLWTLKRSLWALYIYIYSHTNLSKELRSEPIHCIDLVRTKHNLLIVKTLLFENDLSKHFVNVTFSYDNGQTDSEINICFCNFKLPSRIVMFHRISTLPIQQILKFYEFQQLLFIIGSFQWIKL